MLTRQTFYSYDSGSALDWDDATIVYYYYRQPVKDVAVYYIMNAWYHILDIPFIAKRVCKRAKAKSVLPRDCGLEHDHAGEPEECWWICPCADRNLRIHNYRNRNAELIKDGV